MKLINKQVVMSLEDLPVPDVSYDAEGLVFSQIADVSHVRIAMWIALSIRSAIHNDISN